MFFCKEVAKFYDAIMLFRIVCAFAMAASLHARDAPNSYRFDFGEGPAAPGYTKVTPETTFTKERGYGLGATPAVKAVTRKGANPLRNDFLTADKPFFFAVALPEGNYKVTVTLGDQTAESITTVKAELRRLMLEAIRTKPGEFVEKSFIVNIRTPRIPNEGEVRLKPREKTGEIVAWDDKLTLEFNDSRPAIAALTIEPAAAIPVLYIAGDSTSTDQPGEPFNSWGQMITRFLAPTVAVANHGESGETLRSFIGEKRLAKVMSLLQPQDFVMIQMGHNDMKEKGEGIGAFTSYKTDLKRVIAETRKHGATPILITSMNRRTFDPGGHIVNSLGDYPEVVRQTAVEEHVALIDLNAMSKTLYEAIGVVDSPKAFAPGDVTHHNNYGSYELAKCVFESIRAQKLPLARFLLPDVAPFDPAHPDALATFRVPASTKASAEKPYGY